MEILRYICQVFALDAFEQYCVAAALELTLDAGISTGRALTAGEAVTAWGGLGRTDIYEYFECDSTLMRYFFEPDSNPLVGQRLLRLKDRMLDLLMGRFDKPYSVCSTVLWRRDPQTPALSPDDKILRMLTELYNQQNSRQPMLVGLYGDEGAGRKYHVAALFDQLKCPVFFVDARVFCGDVRKDMAMADDILRECLFFQAGLMLLHLDLAAVSDAVFERLFFALPVIFAGSQRRLPARCAGAEAVWLNIPAPGYEEALNLWQQAGSAYMLAADVHLEQMPDKFVLTPGMIMTVLAEAAATARAAGRTVLMQKDLDEACHYLLGSAMGKKAQRVKTVYDWDELVLPAYQKNMLRVACDQVRYKHRVYEHWGFERKIAYGRGLSLVFSGLPGTGKTMAAQVMASQLGMALYRVDLAAVVSKYIGETEKNLEEIFEQARLAQVILFFDEADVLFGKRTEVKEANDKYSNMEAAYMLQKIESYEGVIILSTNYIQNFDEAFKRRMKMIVEFPFPDRGLRRELWRQVFPVSLPLAEDVDLDFLAGQFEFSGSNIKNAALYASFLAAAKNRPVSMTDLICGVRNECAKTGKTLQADDLGEYYMLFRKAQDDV